MEQTNNKRLVTDQAAGTSQVSITDAVQQLTEFKELQTNLAQLRKVRKEFQELLRGLSEIGSELELLSEMRKVAKRYNGYKYVTAQIVWKRLGVSSTSSTERDVPFAVIYAHKVRPQVVIRDRVTAKELMDSAKQLSGEQSIPEVHVEDPKPKEVYEFRSKDMKYVSIFMLDRDLDPMIIDRQGEMQNLL